MLLASRRPLRSTALTLGDYFPEFRPRTSFQFDEHPHWFKGHMSKGRVKLQHKMKDVSILLEVRDARAPFSTAQFELTHNLRGKIQRLVVLNKADLVTPNVGLKMRDLIEQAGQPCLLTNATERKNLIKIKEFALDNAKSKFPRTLGLSLMVIGLPNMGKSTIINGLKEIAFNTARRQGKNSKLMFGVKHSRVKATGTPGETRDVSHFQLSNQPRLYIYDTPGVSLMKRRDDPERNTKLALLSAMPDNFAGVLYLADYLLFRLNREKLFVYVEVLELPGPTDDVRYLAAHVSMLLAQKSQTPAELYWANVSAGAQVFLKLFRKGFLGKLCIDHLPDPEEVQQLRLMRAQTEPPGPWGPPSYPKIAPGLELDRLGPELPAGFVPRGQKTHVFDAAFAALHNESEADEA
eukprot:CAMPEP_0117518768 /NCGR_PEP_ID=MMETSP0784-20121206/32305_1 /TAXON_ID=39447 /ORGANISM="" /LENGTH=406 /DNA_ID=CAMNT_0005314705 /DNA_START=1 /DNA_END=1221 /DNA_ORIENTATION=+